MERAITLTELLVVLIVIGIVATFALPSFWGAKQKAIDRERVAMLQLIQARENGLHLETNQFTICNSTTNCNTNLNLLLPTANHTYKVTSGNVTSNFCAEACLIGTTDCKKITKSGDVQDGGC